MIVSFEVTSPCEGIVQKITSTLNEYVYERGVLLSVREADGSISEVFAQFGGILTNLYVKEGQPVAANTVLASITEKLSNVTLASD